MSSICQLGIWLQTELDDIKSCYQLIKTMTKNQIGYILSNFLLCKMHGNSTHTWWVLSNYKYDVYTVLFMFDQAGDNQSCSQILL